MSLPRLMTLVYRVWGLFVCLFYVFFVDGNPQASHPFFNSNRRYVEKSLIALGSSKTMIVISFRDLHNSKWIERNIINLLQDHPATVSYKHSRWVKCFPDPSHVSSRNLTVIHSISPPRPPKYTANLFTAILCRVTANPVQTQLTTFNGNRSWFIII